MKPAKKFLGGDYKRRQSGVYPSRRVYPLNESILGEDEERELIRRWREDKDISARDRLIRAHLRLVPRLAWKTADKFGYRPPKDSPLVAWDGYQNVCRELVLAGNEGLLIAADRFDPSRGVRFARCAVWSIAKACGEEAKRLRSVVTFPRRVAVLCDTSLNSRLDVDDGEKTTLPESDSVVWLAYPKEATPLTAKIADEEHARLCHLAALLDAKAETMLDPRERQIVRARYLTSQPQRLRTLANEFDISTGRVHQVGRRAIKKLRGSTATLPNGTIEQLAQFYVQHPQNPFVKCSASKAMSAGEVVCGIDDWLDVIKEMFPWATEADRIAAHRLAEAGRREVCDFNLNRVRWALDEGLSVGAIANQFGLPIEAVEHLSLLVEWRRDDETRYSLTGAGLKLIDQINRARDAA